ncbi:hypothetical protein [Luteipulveratus mongoliensis]|uniref:Uncharacterized protein n=1 Tax=Luteipulveratus mongoliensis TaxID=571913 RepID=A0A0K1JE97_9MICO|nr:hypothetical protein [Luteipulveratus mongoliensis]AKU15029.1 hypothetical protein VV02_02745 [Luteipulveratus mongoliensis]
MTPRPPRLGASLARSFAIAWLAAAASTTAHLMAGGAVPRTASAVAVVTFLSFVGLPLTRRELTTGRTTCLLAVLQVLVHVAHMLSAGRPSPVHGGHGHLATSAAPTQTYDHTGHDMGAADLLPTPTMLVAHAAVALLIGWVLSRSEGAWRFACAVYAVLSALPAVARARLTVLRLGSLLFVYAGRPSAVRTSPLGVGWRRPHALQTLWSPSRPARRGPPVLRFA